MKMPRLIRDTQGAALLEFAVTAPIFFLLVFGTIQAALMLWSQIGLQHGAEVATRCASLSDSAVTAATRLGTTFQPTACYTSSGTATANQTSLKNYAAANAWGLKPPASTFTVSVNGTNCPGGNMITASYPFTAITFLYNITLTATSCYPIGTGT